MQLLSGNEAIAAGARDAGACVASGYPGTPSTETLEAFAKYDGVYAEWAINEKVALEVALGASAAGARTLFTCKHVGVNVAADPLFTAAYTGVGGGLVMLAADDPGMYSSQNEQDSHYFAAAAHVVMLDPADSQEAYDFTRAAYDLSERFDVPVFLRTTVRVSHTQTPVNAAPAISFEFSPYESTPQKWVMMPANAKGRRINLIERTANLKAWAYDTELNRIILPGEIQGEDAGEGGADGASGASGRAGAAGASGASGRAGAAGASGRAGGNQPEGGDEYFAQSKNYTSPPQTTGANTQNRRHAIGVICAGAVYQHVLAALPDAAIYKLGVTWPLSAARVREFADTVDELFVIEEASTYLRDSVRACGVVVSEPAGGLTAAGELSPSLIKAAFGRELPAHAEVPDDVPPRPPALCAGCPHRLVFKELSRKKAIVTGDIGCYTLGALPPLACMDTCVDMGASVSMSHGMELGFAAAAGAFANTCEGEGEGGADGAGGASGRAGTPGASGRGCGNQTEGGDEYFSRSENYTSPSPGEGGGADGAGGASGRAGGDTFPTFPTFPTFTFTGREKRPVVGIIGDSTFAHSGLSSLISTFYNGGVGTICVLDNRTTAMTGRQGNPFNGTTLQGRASHELNIEAVVRAIGIDDVCTVDPNDMTAVREALTHAIDATDRLSVVVFKAPCILLDRRRERPYAVVNCTGCGVCITLGCPAIGKDPRTGLAFIDANACIGCGQCAQYCRFSAIVRD